jgi:hypothetical protein
MMQQKDLDSKAVEILNIKKLIKERDEAKESSNYVKSDALRDQLVKDYDIEIFDQKNGPSGWKYKDGRSKKLPNGMIIPDNLKVKRKRDDNVYSNDDVDGKGDSLTKKKNKQAVTYSNDGDVKSKKSYSLTLCTYIKHLYLIVSDMHYIVNIIIISLSSLMK